MVTVNAKDAAEKAAAVKAGALPGPAKSLAEAMARIYADGGRYVQKTGRMDAGPARYTYAREGDFIAAVRPLMETHGVTVSPVSMQVLTNETFERRNGGTAYRVVVLVTFRFLHSSGDQMTVQAIGEGQDSGDKAFNKAMTAAMKYALRQSFCVETGDDPDDTPSHEQERASRPAPVAASRPSGDNHNPAIAKLAAAYASCKDMAGFERLEQERAQLWTRIDGAAKNRLKPIADETKERLAGAAV